MSRSSTNRTVIWRAALGDARLNLVDAGDAADRLFHRLDDRRRHLVRAGARQRQRHVDRRRVGLRETGRRRGRGTRRCPSTTSDMTSIVAKTGRRTQRSESTCGTPLFRRPRRASPSASVSTSVIATRSPSFTPLGDLDAVAKALADLQLAHGQAVAVDDEHPVHAVAVLERGIRQRQHVVDLAALDVDAREGARLQRGVGVRHGGLERERSRRGVHGRADPAHLAVEGAVRDTRPRGARPGVRR